LLRANREFLRAYKKLQSYKELSDLLERTERKFNEINGYAPSPLKNRIRSEGGDLETSLHLRVARVSP